jgi:hypothetical protein
MDTFRTAPMKKALEFATRTGIVLSLAFLPFASAACSGSTDNVEASPNEGALSSDEHVVGSVFVELVASVDPRASVASWEVLTVHNSAENSDYMVAIGYESTAGRLAPIVEAVARTGANGKRDFFLHAPDPNAKLELSVAQMQGMGMDLAMLAKKLDAQQQALANPSPQVPACPSRLIGSATLSTLSAALLGVVAVAACLPGEVATVGVDTPFCIADATLATASVVNATLADRELIRQCWKTTK